MKILHVIFSFDTGGSETMLVDIVNEQSIYHQVELMIVNESHNLELIKTIKKEVNVHCINRREKSKNPKSIVKLNYLIFKMKPDVIHFHNHNGIKLLGFRNNYFTCLTVHTINVAINNLALYDRVFSISNSVRDDLAKRGGPDSTIIYNGIDFSKIKVSENSCASKIFKIVQVGRLDHKVKGQDIIIKAIHALVNRHAKRNIQYDLIGEGSSLDYLQGIVRILDIEDKVNFLGMRPRGFVYENLRNYNLLVQPSSFEGFGLTIVEGMASKIPVLVSDVEGPMEIIKNGKFGYYFKAGDVDNCEEMILKLMNLPSFTEKSDLTYAYVNENFNIKNTVQKYFRNYSVENGND